ncbi:ComEA family DNA-binding protein [Martelella alba]|uniref:Helix-hairpin-helix domain-containing protein n=1 Tax=Martelella alba TaxID=2590451 RepID=A0ABY2SL96_9HYPH|nr:helix-hairpin-helix domain-containing protein [Martelella alba]TKI06276.1 helix-hairpin-helix domain-containing protein [Martelella alba]
MRMLWNSPLAIVISAGLFFMPLSTGAVVHDGSPTIAVGENEQTDAVGAAAPAEEAAGLTELPSADQLKDSDDPLNDTPTAKPADDSRQPDGATHADSTGESAASALEGKRDQATQTDDTSGMDKSPRAGDKKGSAADSSQDDEDQDLKVNINTADEDELVESLKGIGPTKAKEIVKYREKHGPFKRIDHLKKVKGIGPAIFEEIKSQLEL